MSPDAESMKLLRDARAKAAALLEQLLHKQKELDETNWGINQDRLAQGQITIEKAVDAARRAVASLDEALQSAATSTN